MIPYQRPPVPPPPPLTLCRLLLVEGDTPMHFFEALLRELRLDQAVEIRNFHGIGQLTKLVVDLAATPEFQTLPVTSVGVVRDAENDAPGARQSVESALQAAGLAVAGAPAVKTAIFILPDNSSPGMLETLCMSAVETDPALATACRCTAEFFACLKAGGVALPAEPRLAKNRAQAFLATQTNVQLFPGQAAHRGQWPFSSAVFDPLKQFLQAL